MNAVDRQSEAKVIIGGEKKVSRISTSKSKHELAIYSYYSSSLDPT
jgi:hypothetical protein